MKMYKERCGRKGRQWQTRNFEVKFTVCPEIAQIRKRCGVTTDDVEILAYYVEDKSTCRPKKRPAEKSDVCVVESVEVNGIYITGFELPRGPEKMNGWRNICEIIRPIKREILSNGKRSMVLNGVKEILLAGRVTSFIDSGIHYERQIEEPFLLRPLFVPYNNRRALRFETRCVLAFHRK